MLTRILVLCGALVLATKAQAQCGPPASAQQAVRESLLVQPAWLVSRLRDERVVVLFVGDRAGYDAGHIPGAILADAHAFSAGHHDLPPVAAIVSAIERLGISNSSRVILYGDAWMTGWMYLVLDYVGHGDRTALLDGGLTAWRAAGNAVTTQATAARRPGSFTPRPRANIVVTADWIRQRLRNNDIAIIDNRTTGEYRDGHIPGAALLEWERTFSRPAEALQNNASPLIPAGDINALLAAAGVTGNRTPVLYCTVGMRASHMYFVARYLGYDPVIYDGSWTDWTQHSTNPVATGTSRGALR